MMEMATISIHYPTVAILGWQPLLGYLHASLFVYMTPPSHSHWLPQDGLHKTKFEISIYEITICSIEITVILFQLSLNCSPSCL